MSRQANAAVVRVTEDNHVT